MLTQQTSCLPGVFSKTGWDIPEDLTEDQWLSCAKSTQYRARVVVTAVDVATGELVRFGNTASLQHSRAGQFANTERLTLDHILASCSLPPGFPETAIKSERDFTQPRDKSIGSFGVCGSVKHRRISKPCCRRPSREISRRLKGSSRLDGSRFAGQIPPVVSTSLFYCLS